MIVRFARAAFARLRAGLACAVVVVFAATGCSGGSQPGFAMPPVSQGATPSPGSAGLQSAEATVGVRIVIPDALATNARSRHLAYISPGSNSLSIVEAGAAPQVFAVGPSASNCTAGPDGRSCAFSFAATSGPNQTFTVALFASSDATGTPLSAQTIVADIVAGQHNLLHFTLNGIVASLALAVVDPTLAAGQPGGTGLVVNALDASGNTILGAGVYADANGTPLTILLADGDTSGATSLAQTSTTKAATIGIAYTGAALSQATFTARAGGLSASAVVAFASPPASGTKLRAGHIVMPPGTSLSLASLSVSNSLGRSAVSSSGAFLLPVWSAGPQLATVQNAAGTILMFGFLSDAEPDVTAHTSAETFMYYAAGAYTLPDALQSVFVAQIGSYATEPGVEAAVTTALRSGASDPLKAGHSAIAAALAAALPGPSVPPTGPSAAVAPAIATARARAPHVAASTRRGQGLLTAPSGQISGLTLIQQFPNTVSFENVYRRPAEVYVDETIPYQKSLSTLPLYQIPSIPSLNGNAVLTVSDILSGNFALTPASSPDLTLPAEPGFAETDYTLQALGPGNLAGGGPLDADQRVEFQSVDTLFFVQNVALPFLFSVVLPIGASGYDAGTPQSNAANTIGDVVSLVNGIPGVAQQIASGDSLGALQAIESAIAASNTYQSRVLNDLAAASTTAAGTTLVSKTSAAAFKTLGSVLALAGVVLSSIDLVAVKYSLSNSHALDTWTVRVTPEKVSIVPATATVGNGGSVSFKASVPDYDTTNPATSLIYQWSLSAAAPATGSFGTLTNATASSPSVTYAANDVGVGTDTLTLTVTNLDPATAQKTVVGTASATIAVTPAATPSPAPLLPGTFFSTGAFTWTSQTHLYQDQSIVGESAAVNAGNVTFTITYASKNGLGTPTDPGTYVLTDSIDDLTGANFGDFHDAVSEPETLVDDISDRSFFVGTFPNGKLLPIPHFLLYFPDDATHGAFEAALAQVRAEYKF